LETSYQQLLTKAAESPPGVKGLLFLPFLVGRSSPDFNPDLRASLVGLSREHSGAEVARAVLEGVAFSIRHCLDEMSRYHQKPQEIVIGGGGFRSTLWQQIVADVTGQELYPLAGINAGPMGTAWAVAKTIGWLVWSTKLSSPVKPKVLVQN
jgi:xylulokinase